jgi:hypothetical protein
MDHFEFCRSSQLPAAAHTSFQLLDKQPNFVRQKSDAVFGLAGACADKIQLRFQKRIRQLADAEPANFDDAGFLRQLAKELDMSIMFFLS